MEVSLAEAAFGVARELKVDTAVVCTTCDGEGTAPGTHPVPCETCRGTGEVAHVQRSFLGEIRTLRPCSACRGYGTLIPDPCRECSGDGRVRARRIASPSRSRPGVDTGTRVQLAGQGEVGAGRRPGRRPLRRGARRAARDVHPRRHDAALHGDRADDRGRARARP